MPDRGAGYVNQDIKALLAKEGLVPEFLRWVLQSKHGELLKSVDTAAHGTKRIDLSRLLAVEIPFPPRSEQRRVVEILDQADALRRLRIEGDAKARRILPALFLELFGEPSSNPKGWDTGTLGSIALKMSDGPFGSNLKTSHYTSDGVRVFRLQNVGAGYLNDADKASSR